MEKSLTGVKDVDLEILSNLNDADLLNFCSSHKYGKILYNKEDFWRNRLEKFYSDASQFKSSNRSWKDYYLKLSHYLNKAEKSKRSYSDLYEDYKRLINYFSLRFASLDGDEDLINYFLFRDPNNISGNISTVISRASYGGHKKLVEFYVNKAKNEGLKISLFEGFCNSVYKNHFHLVKFLLYQNPEDFIDYLTKGIETAACGGSLQLVEFFINKSKEKGLELDLNNAFYLAIFQNHMDLVKYLEKKTSCDLDRALYEAGASGNMDMVQYIINLGAKNWERGKAGAYLYEYKELVKYFNDLIELELYK